MKNYPEFLHVRWSNLLKQVNLLRREMTEHAEEHADCFEEFMVWKDQIDKEPVLMRRITELLFFQKDHGFFQKVGGRSQPHLPLVRRADLLQIIANGHEEVWRALVVHRDCKIPTGVCQTVG